MSAVPNRERTANPWLDLVRAAAILLVMLRHGERWLHDITESSGAAGTLFMNGWIGVDLFFVLSGYLIAKHLFGAHVGTDSFRFGRYMAMRALRIVPAYFAVLALILVGAFPLYALDQTNLTLRVTYHLLFLQDYLPSNINVVFWSLGVEEKFYFLAPLLMIALLRCRSDLLRYALLAGLFALPAALRASAFLGSTSVMGYDEFFFAFRSPFHMSLDGLVVGVAIAVIERRGVLGAFPVPGTFLLIGSATALLLWSSTHELMEEIGWFDAVAQPSLIAFLGGVATLGAVQLRNRPMPFKRLVQVVSRLSYSLYLVHLPLIPWVSSMAEPWGIAAFWLCYFALSLFAASLLHLLVERPFLRWKDAISASTTGSSGPRRVAPVETA